VQASRIDRTLKTGLFIRSWRGQPRGGTNIP
jgi:hypothetical protein